MKDTTQIQTNLILSILARKQKLREIRKIKIPNSLISCLIFCPIIPRYAFLSFGQGPRNCAGMRFALLAAKTGLVSVLRKYSVSVCEKTVDKIKLDPKSQLSANVGGIWLKITARK